ncbi:serine/threonine-protein kinase RIO3-like [Physella acuta]|uniref:serine/threonine-protein kinase RIO3-like n=1 Tax=Physella acuta TaxID=109671 RepID=UPI0027DCB003|nr:serine/threonine-protein kinase RIO3-like [Physella acuta]XP_059158949.1 serine/threonine-protein kinase RIO3-like [Physella acuta]
MASGTLNPITPVKSPWGKVATVVSPCSLEDVMSEQLALEMDKKQHEQIETAILEEQRFFDELKSSEAAFVPMSDEELAAKLAAEELGENPNDEVLARFLQKEFDKEYDEMIDKVEKKHNGTNKVSISYENYKMKHQHQEIMDEEEDSYDEDYPEFPAPTSWDSPKPLIGSRGYSGNGKNIITKHDGDLCARRNAERLMDFPPDFESGDGEGMDMRLPNHVYNQLKSHSVVENKKSHKIHEKKDHSTAIKAVDQRTRILLFKMVNSGYLSSIDGITSEGKEAMVFTASGGMKDEVELPKHVILKVFKTTMNEFRTRAKYVQGDHRLSKDVYKKQNPRKIIKLWAEKEYLNLKKMRRQNIPCPTPLTLKKHILAMTCIGGEKPAPKLKETKLALEDLQIAYEQTVELIKNLYHKCGLIHADLSEYNLLWHEGDVWVLDVSQSVEKENPNSHDFLLRDITNVCDYFRQAGVPGVSTPEDLFMEVTNYSLQGTGKEFAAQVQRYNKTEYAFDYYFEQSEEARDQELDSEDSSEDSDDEATQHISSEDPSPAEQKTQSNIQTQQPADENILDSSS